MRALLGAGIGVETAVRTSGDARTVVACGLAGRVTRVLVEPGEAQAAEADAIPMVSAIHQILDRADVRASRLLHSDGKLTWILIDAVRRHPDTRVGLEDALYLPDGSRTPGNAAPGLSRPRPWSRPARLATRPPAPAPLTGRQPHPGIPRAGLICRPPAWVMR